MKAGADLVPSPAQLTRRPVPLAENLHEVKQRLGRLLQTTTRVEFQLAVKVMTAREDVRAGKPAERQLRPVGSAANWHHERLEARSPRRFACVLRQIRMVLQNLFHVLV